MARGDWTWIGERQAPSLDVTPPFKPLWISARTPISCERQQVRAASSYLCYYGHGQVDVIATFDLAILAAEAFERSDLERLNAGGTVTLGYVSLGQDASDCDAPWVRRSAAGGALEDDNWGTYLVNPAHPAWKQRCLSVIAELLKKGYGGLFLDTLDSVRPEDQVALVALIGAVRDQYPDIPLVLNRGFALLEPLGDRIDGVMFESLSCAWQLEDDGRVSYCAVNAESFYFNQQFAQRVSATAKLHGLICLALDYTDSPALEAHARAVAKELGYVAWCADRVLSRV